MAKPKKKFYDKKLYDAGIGSVLLCVFAFVFSGLSLLLEPVGYAVHSSKYDLDIGLFSGSPWYNYTIAYDKHIIIFCTAFAAMLICIKNMSRKKLGAEFGIVLTFASAAYLLISSTALLSAYDNGLLSNTYAILNSAEPSQDFRDFERFMAMLYYLLPLFSSALLLIAGLMLWGRSATEEFKVKCPAVVRVVETVSAEAEKPAETAPKFEYKNDNFEQSAAVPAAAPAAAAPEVLPSAPVPAGQEPRPYDPFTQLEAQAVVPPVPEPAAEPEQEAPAEAADLPEAGTTAVLFTEPAPQPEAEAEEPAMEPAPEVQESGVMFCSDCGAKLKPDAKFCSNCGAKV